MAFMRTQEEDVQHPGLRGQNRTRPDLWTFYRLSPAGDQRTCPL